MQVPVFLVYPNVGGSLTISPAMSRKDGKGQRPKHAPSGQIIQIVAAYKVNDGCSKLRELNFRKLQTYSTRNLVDVSLARPWTA